AARAARPARPGAWFRIRDSARRFRRYGLPRDPAPGDLRSSIGVRRTGAQAKYGDLRREKYAAERQLRFLFPSTPPPDLGSPKVETGAVNRAPAALSPPQFALARP